ncbi:5-formyltetrahydrofolate cyclo-ligase, partial [Francisella tularensis subsp. holarctica]
LSFKKIHKWPLTIGIACDEQQNNAIIIDKHDINLDLIITPTRIL